MTCALSEGEIIDAVFSDISHKTAERRQEFLSRYTRLGETEKRILALRFAGMTYREIGKREQIAATTACARCKKAIEQINRE